MALKKATTPLQMALIPSQAPWNIPTKKSTTGVNISTILFHKSANHLPIALTKLEIHFQIALVTFSTVAQISSQCLTHRTIIAIKSVIPATINNIVALTGAVTIFQIVITALYKTIAPTITPIIVAINSPLFIMKSKIFFNGSAQLKSKAFISSIIEVSSPKAPN